MSNALAIAAVTASLTDLLETGISNADIGSLGQIDVSSKPPDTLLEGDPRNALNIFPWKITHNPALSNRDLPARGSAGRRISRNRLALDIHYILTATGSADLNSSILMGYGMQILHEAPVLGRDFIRASTSPPSGGASMLSAGRRVLANADLADQIESVRIIPAQTEHDELSKIWPAFNAALRLSALYQVSVVLIETQKSPQIGLPVREVSLRVDPILRPRIISVTAQNGDRDAIESDEPLAINGRLLIKGSGLTSDNMRVQLGAVTIVPQVAANDATTDRVSETEISVRLPSGTPSPAMAGILSLRVEHLYIAANGTERQREISPPFAVVIPPNISQITQTGTIDANGRYSGQITVDLSHRVGAQQTAQLLLDPAPQSTAAQALSVKPVRRSADGIQLNFPVSDADPGRYMYRLDIDGAQTALSVDQTNHYSGPVVTLETNP